MKTEWNMHAEKQTRRYSECSSIWRNFKNKMLHLYPCSLDSLVKINQQISMPDPYEVGQLATKTLPSMNALFRRHMEKRDLIMVI